MDPNGPVRLRDPRRTRNRLLVTVTIIIVVLVVLNAISYSTMRPPGKEGDGGGGDHVSPYEPIIGSEPTAAADVRDDTTWTARTLVLDQPVRVKSGASLRLVDCDVTVMLEDLVFWRRPAFEVERGGSLVVERSNITIFQDPRFETSVMSNFWQSSSIIPYFARPVNLTNAREPVLHMDVSWWGKGTPLAVGVLPEGGTAVTVLRMVEPGTPKHHEWMPVDVALRAYAGTVPWVVVFLSEPQRDLAFVGNVTVLDGGRAPYGDVFPTGNPLKDGWTVGWTDPTYFMGLHMSQGRYVIGTKDVWKGLIAADGDVSIAMSRIVAPSGLTRRVIRDVCKEEMDHNETASIDLVGAHGGHILTNGSSLSITDSVVQNVPIHADSSELSIRGTSIAGDCDLLSLRSPRGHIESTTFDGPPRWDRDHMDDRFDWLLGIEDASPSGPLNVSGCTFRDGELGLDLDHAEISLDGCTFDGVQQLAVWDHDSSGLGDWAALSSRNRFVRCPENLYLRSHRVTVEFYASGAPNASVGIFITNPLWYDGVELLSPIQGHLISYYGDAASAIVPDTLVTRDGSVQSSKDVRMRVVTTGGETIVPIGPDDRSIRWDLSGHPPAERWEGINAPASLSSIMPAEGGEAGEYSMHLAIDISHLEADNVTLQVVVDGAAGPEVDPYDATVQWGITSIYLSCDATFGQGWHDVEVVVRGRVPIDRWNITEEPVEIDRTSLPILMLLNSTDLSGDRRPFSAERILLAPGVELSLSPGPPADGLPDERPPRLNVTGGNGSRLRLEGPGPPGGAELSINAVGGTSIDIEGATEGGLSIVCGVEAGERAFEPGTVTVSNSTCGTLYIGSSYCRGTRVLDTVVSDYLYLSASGGRISVANCTMQRAATYVDLHGSDLSVTDCDFITDAGAGVRVSSYDETNTSIADSAFDGAYLAILRSGADLESPSWVNVTGCTFDGDGAYLYVGTDVTDMTYYDLDPAAVPAIYGRIENDTFNGTGTGAVMHHGLFGRAFHGNSLEGGARLYAMYVTYLMVIHTDGETPRQGSWAIIEGLGVTTELPFGLYRWNRPDGELLFEITGDVSKESGPLTVPILIGQIPYDRFTVRGFSSIDLLANNGEVTYSAFLDWNGLLALHVTDHA